MALRDLVGLVEVGEFLWRDLAFDAFLDELEVGGHDDGAVGRVGLLGALEHEIDVLASAACGVNRGVAAVAMPAENHDKRRE